MKAERGNSLNLDCGLVPVVKTIGWWPAVPTSVLFDGLLEGLALAADLGCPLLLGVGEQALDGVPQGGRNEGRRDAGSVDDPEKNKEDERETTRPPPAQDEVYERHGGRGVGREGEAGEDLAVVGRLAAPELSDAYTTSHFEQAAARLRPLLYISSASRSSSGVRRMDIQFLVEVEDRARRRRATLT